MPLRQISSRLKIINKAAPGYISALSSGYLLMGANILVQFVFTPFYLKHLGQYQFGLFMMLLNMVNFAAIGITWISGGLVRILGEQWINNDKKGFRHTFVVGKCVFTLYATGLTIIILGGWWITFKLGFNSEPITMAMLLTGFYFIIMYEGIPERQAFVGTNRQATGNQLELARLLLFALLTWLLLPKLQDISVIWIALIIGVAFQRIVSGLYWSQHVSKMGWESYQPEMKSIFKRLVGKQGLGYFSYGTLLLLLQTDTIIIGFLGGPEIAGQFVLFWKIPETIGLLLWRMPSSIEPRVIQLDTSGKQDALYNLFCKGRRWFALLVLVAAIIYILTGQWLTELWVGEHAPKEQWMYLIAGAALFFNALARWPIAFAYALIRLKPLIQVAFIEVIGKLTVTIALFSYLGIAAPIVATVFVHSVYVAWSYQKLIKCGGYSV